MHMVIHLRAQDISSDNNLPPSKGRQRLLASTKYTLQMCLGLHTQHVVQYERDYSAGVLQQTRNAATTCLTQLETITSVDATPRNTLP